MIENRLELKWIPVTRSIFNAWRMLELNSM